MLTIKKIMFPTDFSTCSDQALSHAVALAQQNGAELHVLHVLVPFEYDPQTMSKMSPTIEHVEEELKRSAAARISGQLDRIEQKPIVTEHVLRGISVAPVLIEYAAEHDMDLIAMGTHGRRNVARFFLGSVAEEVIRHSPCPALTVREDHAATPPESVKTILLPVDFSEHSKNAVSHAKHLAAAYKARLILLHVIEESIHPSFYVTGQTTMATWFPEIRSVCQREMTRMLESSPGPKVQAELHIVEGRAAHQIIEFTKEQSVDLIVISTHGLTGIERFLLGSVTEKVVRAVRCPVFTIKSFGKSLLPGATLESTGGILVS
jgi:nucleotide-binding universal stress UspA family protein